MTITEALIDPGSESYVMDTKFIDISGVELHAVKGLISKSLFAVNDELIVKGVRYAVSDTQVDEGVQVVTLTDQIGR